MRRERTRTRRLGSAPAEQLALSHGDRPLDPTDAEIRQRAYEIYAARGGRGSPAHAVSDWLEAEQELRQARPGRGLSLPALSGSATGSSRSSRARTSS